MKRLFPKLLCAAVLTGFGLTGYAQAVNVTATGGTASANYATVSAAFAAINAGTHSGTITVGISANTTETGPCILNSSGAGSASYTSVLIQPTVDGVTISGPTATGRGLIELNGADNVTVDGDNPNTAGTNRNLTITNSAAATVTYTSVIRLATSTATAYTSSDNNLIQNVIINGSATGRNTSANTSTSSSENTTFGVVVGPNGGTTPTALTSVTGAMATGTTANNFTINNCAVNQCARGVAFIGTATTSSNGINVTNNTIGAAATLTGNGPFTSPATTVYTKGIYVQGTTAVTISGNTVRNIISYVGTTVTGIELASAIGSTVNISVNTLIGIANNSSSSSGSSAATAILVSSAAGSHTIAQNTVNTVHTVGSANATGIALTGGTPIVHRNSISGIVANSASGWAAHGINLAAGTNAVIANNFISSLTAVPNNTNYGNTYGARGIRLAGGSGHKVYNNSVHLSGAMLGTSTSATDVTAALTITANTITGVDVRNNIFSNVMTSSSSNVVHTAVQIPSGLTSAFNLTLNNNAYFTASGTNNYVLSTVGTSAVTANYTAAIFCASATTPATNSRAYTSTLSATGTNDNASLAVAGTPPFTSSTDLHIPAGTATILESAGAGIASVTDDIDGDARQSPPDIGADEFSGTAAAACNPGTTTAGNASATSTTVCVGGSASLNVSGQTTSVTGLSATFAVSTTQGGPYTAVGAANATSFTSAALTAGTYYYVYRVTCGACGTGTTVMSNEVAVTVAAPTVSATASPAAVCPGASSTLTASSPTATSYAWAPGATLSGTSGQSVTATPTATTTYTVTASDAAGCTASATTTVSLQPAVVVSATATPASICFGDSSTLNAVTSYAPPYQLSSIAYAPVATPASGVTTLASAGIAGVTLTSGNLEDGVWSNIPLPFSFSFYGTSYSAVSVNTNGYILLGNQNFNTGAYSVIPATGTPNAAIYLAAEDLDLRNNATIPQTNPGVVEYFTDGTAPNRRFVVNYTNVPFWNYFGASTTAAAAALGTISAQAILYENGNAVEVHTTAVTNTTDTKTQGIENAAGTSAVAVPGRNYVNWNTTTPDAYRFTPGPVSYTWAPAADLNTTTGPTVRSGATGTTTYTVTLLDNVTGCSDTGNVTVTVGAPLLTTATSSDADNTTCSGQSITLTATASGGGTPYTYSWSDGTNVVGTASTLTVSPTASTTYTVSVRDACLQTATASVAHTVNPLPTLSVTPNGGTLCSATATGGLQLTASGANTYAWTPAAGLSANAGATVTANPTTTTTYTVTGTDANGCIGTTQTTVQYLITPGAPTTTDYSVCNGALIPAGEGLLSTGVLTGTATLSFNVSAQPTETNSAPGNTVASTTMPTLPAGATITSLVYSYNGITALSDSWKSDVNLGLGGAIVNAAGAGCTSCDNAGAFTFSRTATTGITLGAGSTVSLLYWDYSNDNFGAESNFSTGTGVAKVVVNYSYTDPAAVQWYTAQTGGAAIGSGSPFNPVGVPGSGLANTNTPGTYTYYAEVVNGSCTSATRTAANFNVGTPVNISVASSDADNTTCAGQSITLTTTASGGGTPYAYSWSDGANVAGTTASITVSPTASTTYTVTVSDVCGQTASASVAHTVNPLPALSVTPSLTGSCGAANQVLTASGADTYTWTPATGLNVASGATVTTTATESQAYIVTGTNTATGCINTATATLVVAATPPTPTTTSYSLCSGGTIPAGQGIASTSAGTRLNGVASVAFSVAAQPAETNGGPGNVVASATMPALPAGAVVTALVYDYPGITALGGSWRSDVRLGLSGALVNSAAAGCTSCGSAGTFNYSRVATSGVTFGTGSTVNLLYWDNANDVAAGPEATFPTGTNVASLTIRYTYPNPDSVRWYTAQTGGTAIGSGTAFNPIGVAGSGIPNSNTSGSFTFYAEVGNGICTNANRVAAVLNIGATPTITVTSTDANDTTCAAQSITLTATPSNGVTPYLYSWSDGTNVVSTASTLTVSPTASTTYTVTVTDACMLTASAARVHTVNPLPALSVTPGTASTCGTGSTTLTASGADTYAWTPTTSLTPTTGAVVVSSTAVTRTYTVTGTITATGCTATAQAAITVIPPITGVTATATPAAVCSGAASVLAAATTYTPPYMVSSTAYAPVPTPGSGVTTLASAGVATTALVGTGNLDDGYWNISTLPFTFNFYGTAYTSMSISTNGYLVLGTSTSADGTVSASVPSTSTPNNAVYALSEDFDLTSRGSVTNPGSVTYFTDGTAPNRRFVVNYTNVPFYLSISATTNTTATVQAILNEGSNTLEIHTAQVNNTTDSKVQGVENGGGTVATTVPGRNYQNFTVSTPDAFVFTPTILNYTWSPAAGLSTTSGTSTTATPTGTTTYSVTVSDPNTLCSASANATVTVRPTGTWIGVTSTDWFTPSNWCGGVPTATTDVIIPASGATFWPVLNVSTTVGSFTNSGQMTVDGGAVLTID